MKQQKSSKGDQTLEQVAWVAPESPSLVMDAAKLNPSDQDAARDILRAVLRNEFGHRVADNDDLVDDLLSLLQSDQDAFAQRLQAMKQATDDHPDMLKVKEVADLFRVSDKAVYKWIRQDKVDAVKNPGGSYLLPASQFADVLWRVHGLRQSWGKLHGADGHE